MAGRPKKDKQATTTRMYADTIRLARTIASFRGMTMAEYLEELVKADAERRGAGLIKELTTLLKKSDGVKE